MHTQESEIQKKTNNFHSPNSRGNFSKTGKLIDQTFYIEKSDLSCLYNKVQIECTSKKSARKSTTAFTSVSRQKRPNVRFDIQQASGQFMHKPNHLYGRQKSPSWSFPKKQRYNDQKMPEYEICTKHPIAKKNKQENLHFSTSSIRQSNNSKINLKKSASFNQTMDGSRNYSIILPRKASAVQFFSKTKIKNPLYLTREQIMNAQEELEGNKVIEPSPKGYIQFFKKRPRQALKVSKGFQTYLTSYRHQKQFNNFNLTYGPSSPKCNIGFDKQLERDTSQKQTYGPNIEYINIDPTRVKKSNINLNTSKFLSKIRHRFDRTEPQPTTRLDYDIEPIKLGKNIKINRMLGRTKDFFPIIDPIIKKAGDEQAKLVLRENIPIKQINEAMNPKTNKKISI